MSTRWALRSSRPSSKTAKRPIGPAPMMATSVSIGSLMALLHGSLVYIIGNYNFIRRNRIARNAIQSVAADFAQHRAAALYRMVRGIQRQAGPVPERAGAQWPK